MYIPGSRAYKSAWQETIAAAEEYNEPGRFTAFIGYEWTSNTGGNNLHRNVVFRDNADKASQVEPFTVYPPGSDNPVDLWKWMEAYEQKTGGSVLAIAHNGNLSNGLMFPIVEAFGGRSIASTRKTAPAGNGSTRRPRPRVTARRTRSSHPTTSSPTSSAGTRAISTPAWRRRTRCWQYEYPGRPTRTGCCWSSGWGPIRTSSAWSAALTPTPA